MNLFFLLAAMLTVFISLVHSILGEKRLIGPLLEQTPRNAILEIDFARRTLRAAWHLTTLAWWALAGIMLCLGTRESTDPTVIHISAFTFALTGLALAIGTRGRHRAWVVFALIAACLWMGLL